MEDNDIHPEKPYIPIDVAEDGNTIEVRLVHLEKANIPVTVIFPVIFTDFKLVQSLSTLSSMIVTLGGKVKDNNERQPLNAAAPISVTEDGMVIDVRLLQSRKACISIVLRLDKICTDFKLLHP